jgi:hypothetical protein
MLLNLGQNRDLASVKKSNSRIVLLFFVLTLVTSGSTCAFVTGDLDPNFNTVFATTKPICSDGSLLGASGSCQSAAETPQPSLDQQRQLQQQQQQQQPICSDGSIRDASNCPLYAK